MPLTDLLKRSKRNNNRSDQSKKKASDKVSDKRAKEPEVVEDYHSVNSEVSLAPSIALISGDLELDTNNSSYSIVRCDSNITVVNHDYTKNVLINNTRQFDTNP